MKVANQINIRHITHLAYFGIDLNSDGTLKKFDKPGQLEPGWRQLNSSDFSILSKQIRLLNKKNILVIRAMDSDQIESIINSPTFRQQAIDTILTTVNTFQFDGINIDFEHIGSPDESIRDHFTQFVSQLSAGCKIKNPKCEISLDILADTAQKNRLQRLSDLIPISDQIIVMAYDYYRPSSTQAGPVAPLRGHCNNVADANSKVLAATDTPCLDNDITSSLAEIYKIIPSAKILLGIPFYGYQWQTASTSYLANAYPDTGVIATYKRIRSLFIDPDISSISAVWSDSSLSPYLSFTENGAQYQIYYEDSRSLSLKLDLVNQNKLAGIAIWAIGYETPYQELWNVIGSKL